MRCPSQNMLSALNATCTSSFQNAAAQLQHVQPPQGHGPRWRLHVRGRRCRTLLREPFGSGANSSSVFKLLSGPWRDQVRDTIIRWGVLLWSIRKLGELAFYESARERTPLTSTSLFLLFFFPENSLGNFTLGERRAPRPRLAMTLINRPNHGEIIPTTGTKWGESSESCKQPPGGTRNA